MSHLSLMSSGTGLSQGRDLFHVSWKRILAGIIAGAKRPRTSKTPAVPEAMTLLVTVASEGVMGGMETCRVSLSTTQWIPKALGAWFEGVRVREEESFSRR